MKCLLEDSDIIVRVRLTLTSNSNIKLLVKLSILGVDVNSCKKYLRHDKKEIDHCDTVTFGPTQPQPNGSFFLKA